MDCIFEMHIPDTSCSAIDCSPLFTIFSKCMKDFIRLFISYDSPHRYNQSQIFCISTILFFGFSRFTRFRFEIGFVSIGLQRIFIFGCLQNYGAAVAAVSS